MTPSISKELKDKLEQITSDLIQKTQIAIVNIENPTDNSIVSNTATINYKKIIIGTLSTAIIGSLIAFSNHLNLIIFSISGGVLGLLSSFLMENRKTKTSVTTKEDIDFHHIKMDVKKQITNNNELIRQFWESSLTDLNKNQREIIQQSNIEEEQKKDIIDNLIVYKSLIISDYIYTDTINNLPNDDSFNENLQNEVGIWKNSIIKIINNTKEAQWEQYYKNI